MAAPKPDIAPVLARYGLEDWRGGVLWASVNCPFHDDRHASGRVNQEEGAYWCPVCEIAGDAYEVVMRVEGVDFAEAKRRVEEWTGSSGGPLPPEAASRPGSRARSKLPAWARSRPGRRSRLPAWRG